jgi:hypothetical protein
MTEILLPTNPRYFDDRRVLDVLDFYDGPKAYTFFASSNDFYFAYYADDDGTCEEWLFTPTSESTVNRLVKNDISIRHFFELSDISYLAKMKKGSATSVEKKYFADLKNDYVPDENVFLDCTTTLINVRLVKQGISPWNTSESTIGNVVSHVRKLFRDTMRVVREEDHEYHDCPTSPDFYYNGILAGSVNIVLKPIKRNPLVEKAASIIEKVVSQDFTGLSDKLVERVERSLIPLTPNPSSRLYGFESIEFAGIIPAGTSSKKVSFSLTGKKREELQNKYGENLLTKSVVLTGIADKGTESAEEFVLCDLEENDLKLSDVTCRFDSADIEIRGEVEEAAVWAFMKISASGKKLRVSGDYDMKERVMSVQSIQVQ